MGMPRKETISVRVITGNDEIGLAFQCAGEYLVVVWVSVDFVHFHRSGNKIDHLRKGPEEPVNLLRRCFVNLLKLGAKKGSFDLPEYIFRKADIYLPLTGQRQDARRFSGRHQIGAYDDICVRDDPNHA